MTRPPDDLPLRPEHDAGDGSWGSLAGWADVTPVQSRGPASEPPPGPRHPAPAPPGRTAPVPPAPVQPWPVSPAPGRSAPPTPFPPSVPMPLAPPGAPRPGGPGPGWGGPPATAGYPGPRAPWPSMAPAAWPGPPPVWPGPPPGPAGAGPGPAGTPVFPGAPRRRRPPWVLALAVVAGVIVAAVVAGGLFAVALGSGADAHAPVAAGPAPSATASQGWTDAQRDLAARLDPAAVVGCRPDPTPAGAGVTAALFCTTAEAHRLIAVFGYRDDAGLQADVTARADAAAGDGRCETGGSEVFTWDTGAPRAGGTAVCDTHAGRHFLFWSADDDLVSFLSYGDDPRALFDWWESFQPFPSTAGNPASAPRPA